MENEACHLIGAADLLLKQAGGVTLKLTRKVKRSDLFNQFYAVVDDFGFVFAVNAVDIENEYSRYRKQQGDPKHNPRCDQIAKQRTVY